MYIVQDKEAGNKIDVFDTMFEAKKAIQEYEEQDNKEGTYTTGFYEIIVK
jgi:phage terminase large subunit-like protein